LLPKARAAVNEDAELIVISVAYTLLPASNSSKSNSSASISACKAATSVAVEAVARLA